MGLNRDELLLASRSGHVPRGTHGGHGPPVPRTPAEARHVRCGGSLRRTVGGWCRTLGRSAHGRSGAPGRIAAGGYARRDAYVELEFAVGFSAEDEQWL